jgi:protein-tyrosine phosphatase
MLPGVDDGSSSVEESLQMLRLQAEQGVTHVVATPHFYPWRDSPESFLRRRAEAEKQLRQAMEQYNSLPELFVGAEFYFFSGISDSDILPQVALGKKRCMLIEMPPSPWSDSMYRELEQIWLKWGITPIIAHVNRYISPFHTHHIPERLAELPVLVQANGEFFLQRSTRSMALRMLRGGQIHLLGSDCHNMDSRKPNLGDAISMIEKRIGSIPVESIRELGRQVLGL